MKSPAQFAVVLLDKITDPAQPLRSEITPESVEDLAKSIAQIGLIEPLVVKKSGEMYEVIAGHRRLVASGIANLVEVPCYIVEADDEQTEMMKAHENLYRENLTPIEEGKYFRWLMDHFKWDAKMIAAKIGKSDAYIYARLSIDEYPEDILAALESGQITIGVARELAQIDDEASRVQYTDYAIRSGVSTDVAAAWRQQYKADRSAQISHTAAPGEAIAPSQTIVAMTECFLCKAQMSMREAKLAYAHNSCLLKMLEAS